ncbi:MAG: SPFH domain-containing protein, partial [Myxococcaceae bacterium]|nr:SPFH domain-containing protein [Myxococcaceae bacterium]
MGIFDSIKNVASSAAAEAKRNFIARADDAKDQIIYKYPERNVRAFTQLTVQADELCLFVKDGQVVGKLGPGRHSLESNNLPFLSKLLEKVTGGDLFIAEIYFVSTREFTQIKFGGPIG